MPSVTLKLLVRTRYAQYRDLPLRHVGTIRLGISNIEAAMLC